MFISYAQNFEDVMLWRALKHVARGFYIDVGAQDPVVDSVSLAFYERGWRGVHVEPTAVYAEKLRRARPDETVIQAAIGTSTKPIAFWEFPDTGVSTGIRSIATKHERDNLKGVRVEVPCMRLSRLLSDYRDRNIHWLKIDAEGMERAVIQSWRPAKPRPWIVVVESTKPNSPELAFADWEALLVKLGYEFVYFDGLNRFYVNRKQPELKKHFGPGPNVFDEIALSGTANAPFCARIAAEAGSLCEQAAHLSKRVDELRSQAVLQTETFAKAVAVWEGAQAALNHERTERDKNIEGLAAWAKSLEADVLVKNEALAARDAELARTREALTASDARAKSLEADVLVKNEALAAMYASTSWLITAPLRRASRAARWFVRGSWAWLTLRRGSRPRRVARWFVRGSWAWLTLRPGSRPRRVVRRLRMMLSPADTSRMEIPNLVQDNHNIERLPDLSPRARGIYAELNGAIAQRGVGR